MKNDILRVFKRGIDNPCMCIKISQQMQEKISKYLKNSLGWDDSGAERGDGNESDISIQIPNTSDSHTYIDGYDEEDLKFVNDDDYFSFWELINKIIADAEKIGIDYTL